MIFLRAGSTPPDPPSPPKAGQSIFRACRPFRRPSWGIVFWSFWIILGIGVKIWFQKFGVFDVTFHLVRPFCPTMKISLILEGLKFSFKIKKWKWWKNYIFWGFRTIWRCSSNSWGQNTSIHNVWGPPKNFFLKNWKSWFFLLWYYNLMILWYYNTIIL